MSIKSQQGSSMIIVVFIIVILSIGGAAVSFIANQSAQGIEGVYHQSQATALSKAAIEFSVAEIIENKECSTKQPVFPNSSEYELEVTCTAGEVSYLEEEHAGCDALSIGQDCYFHVSAATVLVGGGAIIQRSLQAEVFVVGLTEDDEEDNCKGNSTNKHGEGGNTNKHGKGNGTNKHGKGSNCRDNGNNTGGDTTESSGSNGKGAGSGANNGFGSGDQSAPGGSDAVNGGENAGGSN